MRIGADQRVGVGDAFAVSLRVKYHAREVLEIDLMHDAGVRRHDAEISERVLPPAQELVAFLVALKLDRGVLCERLRRSVLVDLHRMIDDEFGRRQRIDFVGLTTELDDGVPHGREVDDRRHTREVLHHDATGRERDFLTRRRLRIPVRERGDVVGRHVDGVGVTQQVLQQDLQREGQAVDVSVGHRVQGKNLVVGSADRQGGLRVTDLRHKIISV